jgi:NAD(P)-dependent dehydrogenase (short-subunit alcohol dehydrogenase family)
MRVLVTGASSGIGRATAELLAARGHSVYAGVRGDTDLELPTVQLDVTNAEQVAALGALELDGLVNNAGVAVTGPLEFMPLEELRRQLEINSVAPVAVTQACLPALRRTRGRIVNVSSISGRVALPLFGPYAASKFALEALSDALRRELHGAVEVDVVEPGAIATPIWERSIAAADALWAAMPHEHYGPLVEKLRGEALKQAEQGLAPHMVAETVLTALTARRPRTRYVVGRDAKVQAALARVLPARAMDALLRAALRRL